MGDGKTNDETGAGRHGRTSVTPRGGRVTTASAGSGSEVAALLFKIGQRYAVVRDRLRVGGVSLDFTRPADPDAVLDMATAEESRGGRQVLPYWAELWESSRVVGGAAHDRLAALRRESAVLDLGCGLGLAGCCAMAAGAAVTFGDVETAPLLFARLNAARNRRPGDRRPRVRRVDWRADDLGRAFDLILGADVLYDRAEWPFLEPFLRRHLTPGGTVLLGEPSRPSGGQFLDWLAGAGGWSVDESASTVEGRDTKDGRPTTVRLFALTRRA